MPFWLDGLSGKGGVWQDPLAAQSRWHSSSCRHQSASLPRGGRAAHVRACSTGDARREREQQRLRAESWQNTSETRDVWAVSCRVDLRARSASLDAAQEAVTAVLESSIPMLDLNVFEEDDAQARKPICHLAPTPRSHASLPHLADLLPPTHARMPLSHPRVSVPQLSCGPSSSHSCAARGWTISAARKRRARWAPSERRARITTGWIDRITYQSKHKGSIYFHPARATTESESESGEGVWTRPSVSLSLSPPPARTLVTALTSRGERPQRAAATALCGRGS